MASCGSTRNEIYAVLLRSPRNVSICDYGNDNLIFLEFLRTVAGFEEADPKHEMPERDTITQRILNEHQQIEDIFIMELSRCQACNAQCWNICRLADWILLIGINNFPHPEHIRPLVKDIPRPRFLSQINTWRLIQ